MNRQLAVLSIVLPMVSGGCAGLAGHSPSDVPIEDQSTAYPAEQADVSGMLLPDSDATPPAADDPLHRRTLPAGQSAGSSAVVLALLSDAEKDREVGKSEHAAAAIERALSIEPKNPVLWSRLAAVRLQQQDWQQAYILANKSNSLARDEPALQLENWRIIQQAKYRQGDTAGAEEAGREIDRLSGR